MKAIDELKEKLVGKNRSIVFPEGGDIRIIKATDDLLKDGLIKPVLLGDRDAILSKATENGFDLSAVEIINPVEDERFESLVERFVEIRKGKVSLEQAKEQLKDENYFGTMLVQEGYADGMVSGAIHSTADTVRPALQIIKTKPGISRTSGAFILLHEDGRKYLCADAAINITVDAQMMAEIALMSKDTAEMFGIEPKVAMLSFSTNGSASHPDQEKVAEATSIAKKMIEEQGLDLPLDGEMQFDAAIVPEVGQLKFPGSNVAGYANVFIFPSLEAGNIGYKMAQRMGGFDAIGPVLQGLNKPVNDLSRGCTAVEVYQTAIVTAAQVTD
ncbi:phosphate acetyltransferase [Peptoniphilaceae bacterium SGI.131]